MAEKARPAPSRYDESPVDGVMPAIEVKGLVKRFGATVAVDGLDLLVLPGECMGLLGPNGAGKSTTMEILEGLQQPTAGRVRLFGSSWDTDAPRLRPRIGIAPQETRFHERLRVGEALALFRSFYPRGLPVNALLELVRLGEKRHAAVFQLSGGQRQRLSLATALVGDPELLFLDEPTTGLDPHSRRAIWDVIEGLKLGGRTIVLTTHYMEEAQVLCDRVAIIDRGRLVAQGSPTALLASIGGGQVIELVASQTLPEEVLTGIPTLQASHSRDTGHTLRVRELHLALPWLLDAVRAEGITLRALSTRQASLEDVFQTLTGHGLQVGEAS